MKKPVLVNFRIQPQGRISQLCISNGLLFLQDVIDHLKELPYGRTSDRRDLAMVLIENKGTCSAKHALIVQLANENGIRNLKLALCTYGMSAATHPEVSAVLSQSQLFTIPEARCFVKYNGRIYNLCGDNSTGQPEIVSEIEIDPMQTATFKRRYHHNYIENWLQIERMHRKWSVDKIWEIREACIRATEEKCNDNLLQLCCA